MLGFIGSILQVAGRCLVYILIVNFVILLLKNGKDAVRDLADTMIMATKVGVRKAQTWLFEKYEESGKKGV